MEMFSFGSVERLIRAQDEGGTVRKIHDGQVDPARLLAAAEVIRGVHLSGKTAIVTGGIRVKAFRALEPFSPQGNSRHASAQYQIANLERGCSKTTTFTAPNRIVGGLSPVMEKPGAAHELVGRWCLQ